MDAIQSHSSVLDLNGYLSEISALIQNENGKSLSRLLSLLSRQLSKADILWNTSLQSQNILNKLSNCKPWNVIICHYLQSIQDSLNNKFKQAWQSSLSSLKTIQSKVIIRAHNNKNDNIWYLSVINVIFKNVSECAIIWYNNKELDANDIINDTVGEYFQIIREMAMDANITANKVTLSHGLFFTVNQIIKLCDIIKNETMATNALSVVEKFRSILTRFPLSDVVTHLYFMGRYNLQRGGIHLHKAKQDLQYAYNLCASGLNKIRILLLLIPIQIISGYLPNLNKLPRCLYDRFFPIIQALKTGNILLFKKALRFYEKDFINCGIYLLLTKLEMLVHRALVSKIYVIQCKKMTDIVAKPHIVNLTQIKNAIHIRSKQYYESQFNVMFEAKKQEKTVDFDQVLINEIDEDEIQCILSTLIYKKLIGGYVAHNTACCLSKIMHKAFPPVRTCKDWWIHDF